MSRPESALERLASYLRDEPVIAPHVRDPSVPPALGMLAAAGPRAAEAPAEYAVLVEAIREGYLLHYGQPRLLDGADDDLRLLAGDYLYALGLEQLAARGDLAAVRELGDLISISAQLHARDGEDGAEVAEALWVASAVAVAAGGEPDHERDKEDLRGGGDGPGPGDLIAAASERAARAGIQGALAAAADQIGFAGIYSSERG
jgi:hypothetical protein